MALRTDPAQVARFSVFEVDLHTGELRKSGVRVPLQDQPLEVLKALLERPGDLITREELRQRLWRDDTFVDFEDGLNAAIRRLRDALGDNATTPRFVETLPRRGYRFIASLQTPTGQPASAPVETSSPFWRSRAARLRRAFSLPVVPWTATAILVFGVGVMVWRNARTNESTRATSRFVVGVQPSAIPARAPSPAVALSPTGTHLAYVAGDTPDTRQLYIRPLNTLEAKPVSGAAPAQGPFFSPDGNWIAFFSAGTLKKSSLRGGAPVTVCPLPAVGWIALGGSWGEDGTIVFHNHELWRVAADGGTPQQVRAPENSVWPQFLPGSKSIVFTVLPESPQAGVWILRLDTGELRRLTERAGLARYVRSGHLAYAWGGSLFVAPFDISRLQLTGPAVPAIQDAMMGSPSLAHFAVSDTGTLVYLPGPALPDTLRTLVWVDRAGKEERLPVEPRAYEWPRLSPDGSRLAVGMTAAANGSNSEVWVYHLGQRTLSPTNVTSHPGRDERPLWTPDSRRVVFRSDRDREGQFSLFWTAADGTGVPVRLTRDSTSDRSAQAFSPDGSKLVFVEPEGGGYALHLLDVEGQRPSKPLLKPSSMVGSPAVSPDGRWIAYRSNESGQGPWQVYVRPFPDVETGKWQISVDGGRAPVWSPDGRELFYQNRDDMMVAAVRPGATFAFETPKIVFKGTYVPGPGMSRNFDISRDSRRFIMIKEVRTGLEPSAPAKLTVVLNWFEELRQFMPAGK